MCPPSASSRRRSSPRCGSGAAPGRTAPSSKTYSSALVLPAATAANDQLVGFLVLRAGALAERRHAPRGDRVTAALRLAFTAAVRVVDRVHRRAADGRALAEPARAAGLADRHVAVLDVADLADGRAAGEQHAAHLAGRETQRGVALILRDELHARAGGACHLTAPAGLQLHVVHERARRDVLERERVARLDVGADAGLHDRADADAGRREDVALEAVRVVQQRDARRAVRVVLDRGHLRRHAVLGALEVDDAIAALVAAALVARRDATRVVAAALLRQLLGERLLGPRLRDFREVGHRHVAAARARRLEPAYRH